MDERGVQKFAPPFFAEIFADFDIQLVIRCGGPAYSTDAMYDGGIEVEDLPVQPLLRAVDRFFTLTRICPGPIALHGGLRPIATATIDVGDEKEEEEEDFGLVEVLLSSFLIREHGFEGSTAVAWIRMLHPAAPAAHPQTFLFRRLDDCESPVLAASGAGAASPPSGADETGLRRRCSSESLLDILDLDSVDDHCNPLRPAAVGDRADPAGGSIAVSRQQDLMITLGLEPFATSSPVASCRTWRQPISPATGNGERDPKPTARSPPTSPLRLVGAGGGSAQFSRPARADTVCSASPDRRPGGSSSPLPTAGLPPSTEPQRVELEEPVSSPTIPRPDWTLDHSFQAKTPAAAAPALDATLGTRRACLSLPATLLSLPGGGYLAAAVVAASAIYSASTAFF
jgi:hypothetical protein